MKTSNVLNVCCLFIAMGLTLGAAQQPARPSRGDAARKEAVTRTDPVPGDYVLNPQDIIRVYVFQEEDINKQGEVGISSEHTITLPLIGTVNLHGKTVRQAEQMIRELYDKDFLVNPTVSVAVLKYSDRSVNVTGSVKEAGRIQFPQERGLTVVDAITLAGGHDRLADLKRVKITRKVPGGDSDVKEVNVDAIMKGGARDVPLQVGDAVFVPERIL
jgi:protein involved in polysaccharide export with SLBB domain